jgi:hypothetical protein
MSAPNGPFWGRQATEDSLAGTPPETASPDDQGPAPGAAAALPEQPVLLTPVGTVRQVHIGDVLPPARRGWAGGLVRLPVVPKRAILAAGVCAGLVAPTLARHLVTRLLLGPGAKPAGVLGGTLEITRIVYHGPATAEVMSSVLKALSSGRR